MTFDQWCDSKQIKGNFREALYHSLMAKHETVDLSQDELAAEWNIVLDKFMAKAMSAMSN